ncbi:class I SAM-dependent methyltransferase [Nocardia alba]|uniref:Methyltransferase family protein n=1 Tax=Nocardia alba TaxID=225051 RepID=A0A4R1G5F5_9NOCA|nr:methyltransferase domain-containing protein [Nocardia alba]TCK00639.1 methyltransferase family protein [Nocardia alba]
MPDQNRTPTYTHGFHGSVLRTQRWRTAENSAAYLIEHLRAGSTLLDVGCGAGTISADLADLIAPGKLTAVDSSPEVIASARAEAATRGCENIEFAVADALVLPFEDNFFDVVHAHQVLQHVSDPVRALTEMKRVCKPGGVVAVRESDYGAFSWYPESSPLDKWLRLYRQIARANGGEPDAGRRLLAWANRVGFDHHVIDSSTWCFADDEQRRWWGSMWAERITHSSIAEQLVTAGLAESDELAEISTAWLQWADNPDGYLTLVHGELLGIK